MGWVGVRVRVRVRVRGTYQLVSSPIMCTSRGTTVYRR